ncbi:transposase [Spirosoma fluviale]|uniref:Transposase IS200 like n=1 Tax=Spirosoma fluviale TaxID=1597977 RepID=A0A286FZ39_9BACT|nr:transposase [Spirosoma fluviale]SOD88468.1 Transposase IS200 like [Spirosoma fluviale]
MNEPFRDFYRTKLPHIQPLGGTFFVTFRLADSLPQSIRKVLQEEFNWLHKQLLMQSDYTPDKLDRLHRQFFGRYDALLDKLDNGADYLRLDAIARVVADALHFFDEKKYDLIAFTIMSNHVHVVFALHPVPEARPAITLDKVMHSLKSFTATKCNELLDKSGRFWEHESYDRLVRDRNELHRIVQYTLQNPVKAGLCQHWQDWKWTYIKPEYNDFE